MAIKPPRLPKNHPEFDVTGWATVYEKKCSDGRTILPGAFAHMEYGVDVPCVYMHNHKDPLAVLGKAYLYPVKEGVYAGVSFNNTPQGQHIKESIKHSDVCSFSIWAGQVQESHNHTIVHKATIEELSVVLKGANPEAKITFDPAFAHYDSDENTIMFDTMTYTSPEVADGGILIHSNFDDSQNDDEDEIYFYDDDDSFGHASKKKKDDEIDEDEDEDEAEDEDSVVYEDDEEESYYDDEEDDEEDEPEEGDEDEAEDEDNDADDEEPRSKKKPSRGKNFVRHSDDDEDEDEEESDDDTDDDDDDKSDDDAPSKEELDKIFDSFTDKQMYGLAYLLGNIKAEFDAEAKENKKKLAHSDIEGESLTMANLFEQRGPVRFASSAIKDKEKEVFDTFIAHVSDSMNQEGSLKLAFNATKDGGEFDKIGVQDISFQHDDTAGAERKIGIGGIEALYPEPTEQNTPPEFIRRDISWADKFWGAARHRPMSRLRSTYADVTQDEARARGYVKGTEKIEEYFPLLRRETAPTTVYKLQTLNHDDVKDITSFQVINMLKTEMRFMLHEEICRAALTGDGRSLNEYGSSKINPECIRPVMTDAALYTIQYKVDSDPTNESVLYDNLIDSSILAQVDYRGSGLPMFFTSPLMAAKMLLVKDGMNKRKYNNNVELAQAMNVSEIVRCECMANLTIDGHEVLGIALNPADYSFGADKGGEVELFEDFDIKFNRHYTLIETRVSGALNKPKSAIVFLKDGVQADADRSNGGIVYYGN